MAKRDPLLALSVELNACADSAMFSCRESSTNTLKTISRECGNQSAAFNQGEKEVFP